MIWIWQRTQRYIRLQKWVQHVLQVDVHAHWLPGIDDGAKDLQESGAMLALMAEMGWQLTIATPHVFHPQYANTPAIVRQAYENIRPILQTVPAQRLAAEYYTHVDGMQAFAQPDNLLLLCQRHRHLLFEMPHWQPPIFLQEFLFILRQYDCVPVLAHPERYDYLDRSLIQTLQQYGVLLQANLLSFAGYYGRKTRQRAVELLKAKRLHLVGTDAHRIQHLQALYTLASQQIWSDLSAYAFMNSNYCIN